MDLTTYLLRRIGLAFVVLLSVITITFILAHHLGGSIVVAWLGKSAALHPELAQVYAQKYHLNDSIWVQFYFYLVAIAHGDLGLSPSRGFQPVLSVIELTLPYTLQLVFLAFVISMVIGVLLGVVSAKREHGLVNSGIGALYMACYSSPPFFVALVLLIVFAHYSRLLPSGGPVDLGIPQIVRITGFPLVDSLLEGNSAYFISGIEHVILPSVALALTTFGVVTRVLRSSLLDVMNLNFIRAVRAKGLDENRVFYKHGLRNALIPVVTLSSLIYTWLITGTIFVENVFAYPGMGQYVVGALAGQDYPGILGTAIVFALTILIGNLVVDILYAVVDPQIRLR